MGCSGLVFRFMVNGVNERNEASQRGTGETPGIRWIGLTAYIGLLILGIGLFVLIRGFGEGLKAPAAPAEAPPFGKPLSGQVDVTLHVIATLAAVVSLGFVLGRACRLFGQPSVIGEIIAGILLGPSLLGAISPQTMYCLIPSLESDPNGHVPMALRTVSQLGAVLYMFLVGLELNGARLAGRLRAAVAVSHASIVVPFILGAVLSLGLYPTVSNKGVSFTSFSLFMGAAMAITAFPVLARILVDHQLERTELGEVALSCAATDDVTAWCLLALVVGVAQADLESAARVIGFTLAFIAIMFFAVRPALHRLVRCVDSTTQGLSPLAVSSVFFAVLLAALVTEAIGIHAVFGAFLFGALVPSDSGIAREFSVKLKDVVTVLLLPAFFAYTGMRTQIHLVSGWENWFWCGAIILVATVGKFGGTLGAARFTGMGWRDAAALGALMNTRGLMELIVLGIGLDLGIISPTLYAMMVIMALATTLATGPCLNLLKPQTNGTA